jgi:hypothetical protein
MQDPAYQPQPDPKHNARKTDAQKGEPSLVAPDELRDVKAGEQQAPTTAPGKRRKDGQHQSMERALD